MLRAKESKEFHKWLQNWSATVAQSRMVVRHTASGNEPGDDVENALRIQAPAIGNPATLEEKRMSRLRLSCTSKLNPPTLTDCAASVCCGSVRELSAVKIDSR
jgi:hypothetical protein